MTIYKIYFNDKVIEFTMNYIKTHECKCYLFPARRMFKNSPLPVSCHCVIYNENDPENFGTLYASGIKRVLYFPVFAVSKVRSWRFYEEHDYYPRDWDLKGFWENKEYFEIQQNILVDVLENGEYSKFVTEFLERVVECTKKLRQIK